MWNDLTMKQKADVISMAVRAGMRDVDSIKSFYNESVGSRSTNDAMTGMMKSRLATAAHYGNPTARRMTNYDTRSYTWPGEYEYDRGIGEPKRGNVFVSSYGNLVTPQIQDTGNGLSFIDNVWSPENDQRSYMQSLKFNNDTDAQYFGKHYKEVAPMMNLYSKGGSIHIKPEKEYERSNKYPIGGYIDYAANNATNATGAQYYQPGAMETINNVLSYMPITGTVMDVGEFIKEPTWENFGWAVSSLASDALGASLLKGTKVAKAEYKAAKQAEKNAEEALNTHRQANRNIIARSIREEDAKLVKQLNDARWNTALKTPFWDKVIEYPIYGMWVAEDAGLNTMQQNSKAEGGSIHIKPSKRGTFTAAASKHGKSVQEFASQVLSHPENYSLTMRKKANFARNFGGRK